MVTSVSLPDGTVKTVTALSAVEMQSLVQRITLQMLGVALPSASATPTPVELNAIYSQVRTDWAQGGQPTWQITEDVCFVSAVTQTARNLLTRTTVGGTTNPTTTLTQTYGRYWRVQWTFYGPNSSSRAAVVHSGLMESFALSAFKASGLGIIANFENPMRAPELFNAQWWDRSDLTAMFAEEVVSATTVGTVLTVPIAITEQGEVPALGYGQAPYGAASTTGVTTINESATATQGT